MEGSRSEPGDEPGKEIMKLRAQEGVHFILARVGSSSGTVLGLFARTLPVFTADT